ncbi:hypothetical protein MSAN_00528500 [Mycena sanguinolenta]|uniref:Uncharacterized protein n=1 Tax=Mycena sanguinolenta TaxID=230812 RepID=A0A8H6Z900_9AGAR|nr:hypothetical protein MSAN_00528500 [Mycena sanguinolenta]
MQTSARQFQPAVSVDSVRADLIRTALIPSTSVVVFFSMSKLRLSFFLSLLFVSCQVVSASYSSYSSSIDARDGNSSLTSETFTFKFDRPSSSHASGFSDWVTVVCLDPQNMTIDECDMSGFFRCPNSDVSGILVRVSAYLANLLLGIIIMYEPKEASDSVWAQLLTVYSLVISAIIAIYTKGLTRFHAGMTVFLVLSPLSFTLMVYAILGFFGRSHRLSSTLSGRREHLLPGLAVIGACLFGIILFIFTSISNDIHFTPAPPCDTLQDKGTLAAIMYIISFIPYVGAVLVLITLAALYADQETTAAILGIAAVPLGLVIIALVVAIIRSWSSISAQVKMLNINSRSKRLWAYWELFGTRYPFLHFCGVFFIPMIYWVMLNEIRLFGTADNVFTISFGQVLAVFVVLQPLLQVVMMIPRLRGWFMSLAPIRLLTGRQRESIPMPLDLRDENSETVSLKSWEKLEG